MNEQPIKTDNVLEQPSEKRVLIIEDESKMAELLKTRFESHNEKFKFNVDTAEDKNEGLEKIIKNPYDVIVVDRLLKGVWSEFVILKAIADRFPQTVIIIWTAHFSDTSPAPEDIQSLKECMRLGAWDYIPKFVAEGKETTYQQVVHSAVKRLMELENTQKTASALSQEDLRFLYSELYNKYAGKWVAVRVREPIISEEHYIQLIDKLDLMKKSFEEQRKKAEQKNETPPEWIEPLIIKVPSVYRNSGT